MRAGDVVWSSVERLLIAAGSLGVDRARLEALLPPPEARAERLELLDYCRLGQKAIALGGRGEIGLAISRTSEFTHLGLGGLAAVSAPTLGDALTLLMRYEPLAVRSYRGQSRWLPAENKLLLYSIAPYNDYTRFIVDLMLGMWYRAVVAMTDPDVVREARIEFAAPPYHDAYAGLFGCPVYFASDENAVILARDAGRRALRTHDPDLHRDLVDLCEQKLRQLELESRFTGRVQKMLGPMLRGNTPALEAVADALGMASWTLRRKLRDEGTSFQELVDDMRRDLALAYMGDIGLSLGEIAYLLGFSTPGAFQRAFKRWTGTTPGGWRRTRRPRTD